MKDTVFIFLYIVVVIASQLYFKCWDTTQTVAVALTGLVVIWYTIETKKLRAESQKQTEIQQRPFVILKVEKRNFVLQNIGNGPALNVKVNPVQVSADHEIIIRFNEHHPTLVTEESLTISAESFKKGKSAGDFFLAHLDPEYANRILNIVIEYQNIELRKYITKERVSPQKREIIDFHG